jgi:hypothetical protein
MQMILDDLNKTERSSFCSIRLKEAETKTSLGNHLLEKIRKWLFPPDPSVNHNVARQAHHKGTASWFFEGIAYNEWKATGPLLWIHGNRTAFHSFFSTNSTDDLCSCSGIWQKRSLVGITSDRPSLMLLIVVTSSSVIRDIESMHRTGLASVVYYFFDFRDAIKQDRRGLLSSLLTQLCARSHRGYEILLSFYERHQDGLRQPKEGDLIQCLKKVLELPRHGRVYIVVDALDECPTMPGLPSPREKVLRLIKELVDLHHPDIRICITSRPEVDIQTVLEPLASQAASLHDEGGQRSDIIDYIKSVVKTDRMMRRWNIVDQQLVIDSLSLKANGM